MFSIFGKNPKNPWGSEWNKLPSDEAGHFEPQKTSETSEANQWLESSDIVKIPKSYLGPKHEQTFLDHLFRIRVNEFEATLSLNDIIQEIRAVKIDNLFLYGSAARFFLYGEEEVPQFYKQEKDLDLLWLFTLPKNLADDVLRRKDLAEKIENDRARCLNVSIKEERELQELDEFLGEKVFQVMQEELHKVKQFLKRLGIPEKEAQGLVSGRNFSTVEARFSIPLGKIDLTIKAVTSWRQNGFRFTRDAQLVNLLKMEIWRPKSSGNQKQGIELKKKRPLEFFGRPNAKACLFAMKEIVEGYPLGKKNFCDEIYLTLFNFGGQEEWKKLFLHLKSEHLGGERSEALFKLIFLQTCILMRYLERRENKTSFALQHLENLSLLDKENLRDYLDALLEESLFYPVKGGSRFEGGITYLEKEGMTLAFPQIETSRATATQYLEELFPFHEEEIDKKATLQKIGDANSSQFLATYPNPALFPEIYYRSCVANRVSFDPVRHCFKDYFEAVLNQNDDEFLLTIMKDETLEQHFSTLRLDQFIRAIQSKPREFSSVFVRAFLEKIVVKEAYDSLRKLDAIFSDDEPYFQLRFTPALMKMFLANEEFLEEFLCTYGHEEVFSNELEMTVTPTALIRFLEGRSREDVVETTLRLCLKTKPKTIDDEKVLKRVLVESATCSLCELDENTINELLGYLISEGMIEELNSILRGNPEFDPTASQIAQIEASHPNQYLIFRFMKRFSAEFLSKLDIETTMSVENIVSITKQRGVHAALLILHKKEMAADQLKQILSAIIPWINSREDLQDFLFYLEETDSLKMLDLTDLRSLYQKHNGKISLIRKIAYLLLKKESKLKSPELFLSLLRDALENKNVRAVEKIEAHRAKAAWNDMSPHERILMIRDYAQVSPGSPVLRELVQVALESGLAEENPVLVELFNKKLFRQELQTYLETKCGKKIREEVWDDELRSVSEAEMPAFLEMKLTRSSIDKDEYGMYILEKGYVCNNVIFHIIDSFCSKIAPDTFYTSLSRKLNFFEYAETLKAVSGNEKYFRKYLKNLHFPFQDLLDPKKREFLLQFFQEQVETASYCFVAYFSALILSENMEEIIKIATKCLQDGNKHKEELRLEESDRLLLEQTIEYADRQVFDLEMTMAAKYVFMNKVMKTKKGPLVVKWVKDATMRVTSENFEKTFSPLTRLQTMGYLFKLSALLQNAESTVFVQRWNSTPFHKSHFFGDLKPGSKEYVFLVDIFKRLNAKEAIDYRTLARDFEYETREIVGRILYSLFPEEMAFHPKEFLGRTKDKQYTDHFIRLLTQILSLCPVELFDRKRYDVTDYFLFTNGDFPKNLESLNFYLYHLERKCVEAGQSIDKKRMLGIRYELLFRRFAVQVQYLNQQLSKRWPLKGFEFVYDKCCTVVNYIKSPLTDFGDNFLFYSTVCLMAMLQVQHMSLLNWFTKRGKSKFTKQKFTFNWIVKDWESKFRGLEKEFNQQKRPEVEAMLRLLSVLCNFLNHKEKPVDAFYKYVTAIVEPYHTLMKTFDFENLITGDLLKQVLHGFLLNLLDPIFLTINIRSLKSNIYHLYSINKFLSDQSFEREFVLQQIHYAFHHNREQAEKWVDIEKIQAFVNLFDEEPRSINSFASNLNLLHAKKICTRYGLYRHVFLSVVSFLGSTFLSKHESLIVHKKKWTRVFKNEQFNPKLVYVSFCAILLVGLFFAGSLFRTQSGFDQKF